MNMVLRHNSAPKSQHTSAAYRKSHCVTQRWRVEAPVLLRRLPGLFTSVHGSGHVISEATARKRAQPQFVRWCCFLRHQRTTAHTTSRLNTTVPPTTVIACRYATTASELP